MPKRKVKYLHKNFLWKILAVMPGLVILLIYLLGKYLPTLKLKNLVEQKELSIISVVDKWKPFTFMITCWWRHLDPGDGTNYYQRGSGSLVSTEHGAMLLTNKHVIRAVDNTLPNNCLFSNPDGYYFEVKFPKVFFTDINSEYVWIEINDANSKNQQYLNDLSNTSLINTNNVCRDSALGEKIVVLGYPKIGPELGSSINVTEGIVSGEEKDFFVTSAKLEGGNSGGTAISLENNCFLGIPTWVEPGKYETLGRILKATVIFPK